MAKHTLSSSVGSTGLGLRPGPEAWLSVLQTVELWTNYFPGSLLPLVKMNVIQKLFYCTSTYVALC